MAQEYLEKLSGLMAEITPYLSSSASLEIKHFFSGAAVYADERICITYSPAGFAIKVSEILREQVMKENGAKSLQYFSGAPIKKDYVLLTESFMDNLDLLSFWVGKSIDYVLTKPPGKSD